MRVGVFYEASGAVRDAFAARGHDAYSIDLRASDAPGQHICDDVWNVIGSAFFDTLDLAILHPTCTYLCVSGLHWNKRRPERAVLTEEALAEVERLFVAFRGKRYALENPVGIIGTRSVGRGGSARRPISKPTQIVQPYQFGDDASKATCLWLDGLLPLVADPARRRSGRLVEWPKGSGKMVERWSNQTDSGQNALPPSADRWAERSNTYPGIAAAMAEQWG